MSNQGGIYGPSPSGSLVTSTLSGLAEPENRMLDGAALDYMLIEAVNTLRLSAAFATAKLKEQEEEMIAAGLLNPASLLPPINAGKRDSPSKDSISSGRGQKLPEDEEEALRVRLEAIGAHVGSNLAEKLARDRPRFSDTLDTIKFVCKDIWAVVWDKQVDNLRTNHRGVYVLQDNAFKPLLRISTVNGSQDSLKRARIYLAFPSGIIRGALARLGLQATVSPETASLPQCTFQVKLPKGTN